MSERQKPGESSRSADREELNQRECHLPPKLYRKPSRAGGRPSPGPSEPASKVTPGPALLMAGSASGSAAGSVVGSVAGSAVGSAVGSVSGSASGSVPRSPTPAPGNASDWTILSFFKPSAETFRPKPYYPLSNYVPHAYRGDPKPLKRAKFVKDYSESGSLPSPKSYDVARDDPSAVFIHPPFDNLPDKKKHPGRLTFALMMANPNWFLDPADYNRVEGLDSDDEDEDGDGDSGPITNKPGAIAYPMFLEPPRGWCPQRYKLIVEAKRDGEPEHMFGPSSLAEAPTLRCTFCRRKYAGVNAKSMWRRHILEKHRIPMQNRREGADGGRMSGRVAISGCCCFFLLFRFVR